MRHLVFFLEERSAQEMLTGLLRSLLPPGSIETTYIVFEGKQDLEKNLERKLRGWLAQETRFVVMRDQDGGDCVKIKRHLHELCLKAGHPEALIRIACRDLEAFYLGDLAAVGEAYRLPNLKQKASKEKFRKPDRLANSAQEMRNLTAGAYQKVAGSRLLGPLLAASWQQNQSHSFRVLVQGLLTIVGK